MTALSPFLNKVIEARAKPAEPNRPSTFPTISPTISDTGKESLIEPDEIEEVEDDEFDTSINLTNRGLFAKQKDKPNNEVDITNSSSGVNDVKPDDSKKPDLTASKLTSDKTNQDQLQKKSTDVNQVSLS